MRLIYLSPLDKNCLWVISNQNFQVTLLCLCLENVFYLIQSIIKSASSVELLSDCEMQLWTLVVMFLFVICLLGCTAALCTVMWEIEWQDIWNIGSFPKKSCKLISTFTSSFLSLAYLTYMQGTSCKIPGLMKHKMESSLLREISDMQMTPPLRQKMKN